VPVDLRAVKLDLDRKWSACAWTRWAERVAICLREAGVVVLRVEVRETLHGFHVVLHLADELPSAVAVVALQALLGSDGVREAINFSRALADRGDDWNLLFETKGAHTSRPRMDYGRILLLALKRQGQVPRLDAPRLRDMEAFKTAKRVAVS
jgi:hypothetical protein